jgi:hypothetical protein
MSARGTSLVQRHRNGKTTTARNLKLLKRTTTSFEKSFAQDIVAVWNEAVMYIRRDDPVATTRVMECQIQALLSIVK